MNNDDRKHLEKSEDEDVKSNEKKKQANESSTKSLDAQLKLLPSEPKRSGSWSPPSKRMLPSEELQEIIEDGQQKPISSEPQKRRSLSPPSSKRMRSAEELQEMTEPTENRTSLPFTSPASLPSSSAVDSPIQSMIDKIACCIDQFPKEWVEVKLSHLFPVFRHLYKSCLTTMMIKVFGSGNAFEELAKIYQNKFTMERNEAGGWIFHKIVEKKTSTKKHKNIPHCVRKLKKKKWIEKLANEMQTGENKSEKQADGPQNEIPVDSNLSTEDAATLAPVSSGAGPVNDPKVVEIIAKICRCLDLFDKDVVKLNRINTVFEQLYPESLSKALRTIFPRGNVFKELSTIDQNKFTLKYKAAKETWIFQKNVEKKTESGKKEKKEKLAMEYNPSTEKSASSSSDSGNFDNQAVSQIIHRIFCCLLQFQGCEVKLNDLYHFFKGVYQEKLNKALKKTFKHGDALEELAKVDQNKFVMEKKAKGIWTFQIIREEKTGNSEKMENQTTDHNSLPPAMDRPHDAPGPSQPVYSINSPFQPRPQFFAKPMQPPPPFPVFMNDPRLQDFAYRIRHVVVNMGGSGLLPQVEEAYFRTFGSHLQDDFFCLFPYDTLPFVLTEISHGEILVNKTQEGWIYFQLKNFY